LILRIYQDQLDDQGEHWKLLPM